MEWIAQLFWPYDIDDSQRIWSLFLILAGRIFSTHNFHTFPQPIFILFSILFSTFCKCRKKTFSSSHFCTPEIIDFLPPFSSFLIGVRMDAGKKKFSEISALLRDFLTQPGKCEGMEKKGEKNALTGHLAMIVQVFNWRLMKMKKSRLSVDGWRIK